MSPVLSAAAITLENTIPTGNLFLQPPVLTGAAPVFGSGGGVVLADAFTAPVTATLAQVSVVVEYVMLPSFGVTGTAPMLLSLLSDNNNSPGSLLENWTVPLSPSDTTLTIVTVDSALHPSLLAGHQYWLSEVPTDPIHTGIGWGLASSAPPGIQLPIAESTTGTNSGWLPTTPTIANEFSVTGAVPEPATLFLIAVGLLSVVTIRRMRDD